ncbi:MAG: amidohydrolase family protein [Hyphomicrobiales bacterium]|nr:amidohydrolase family protein [Hyphomicrobiales bacterium]
MSHNNLDRGRLGLVQRWAITIAAFAMAWAAIAAAHSEPIVFVNVNVVPMDSERVMDDHTVIAEDGRIEVMGPSSAIDIPADAVVIEGEGAFLIPGLADMHTHLSDNPSADSIVLWLAEGVTTLRNLNGLPEHRTWRDEVLSGERLGPTIYTAGPTVVGIPDPPIRWQFNALLIAGPALVFVVLWGMVWLTMRLSRGRERALSARRYLLPGTSLLVLIGLAVWWTGIVPINAFTSFQYPTAAVADTPAEAVRYVRDEEAAGYDFLKVYDFLSEEAYVAAIREAHGLDFYSVAHLHDTLPLEEILDAGLREIAHVDEFMEHHAIGESSPSAFLPVEFDYSTIPDSVALVRDHDALVVANLVTDEIAYSYLEGGPDYFDRPEFAVVRPEVKARWLKGRLVNWQGQQEWRRNTAQPFYVAMTKALHAAGVPLLAGTDVVADGMVPWHIHRELELLVEAGLSPYEAMRIATVNAAVSVERMGQPGNFGVIAEGHRADLVLLTANPLENISATRDRVGVMARGVWRTQAELDDLVAELVASY